MYRAHVYARTECQDGHWFLNLLRSYTVSWRLESPPMSAPMHFEAQANERVLRTPLPCSLPGKGYDIRLCQDADACETRFTIVQPGISAFQRRDVTSAT